jgi:hypothetical protein
MPSSRFLSIIRAERLFRKIITYQAEQATDSFNQSYGESSVRKSDLGSETQNLELPAGF